MNPQTNKQSNRSSGSLHYVYGVGASTTDQLTTLSSNLADLSLDFAVRYIDGPFNHDLVDSYKTLQHCQSCYLQTENALAGLPESPPTPPPRTLVSFVHSVGLCSSNKTSFCENCVSFSKVLRLTKKFPAQIDGITQQYFISVSKKPHHAFLRTLAGDRGTYENLHSDRRVIFNRAFVHNRGYLSKTQRDVFRTFLTRREHSPTQTISRSRARDLKYESAFISQGLGPIEHERGDCEEQYSMCDDCVSLHKIYTISKRVPERTAAVHGLLWRIMERVPPNHARHLIAGSRYWLASAPLNATNAFLQYYFMYAESLGNNYLEKGKLYDMVKARQMQLEAGSQQVSSASSLSSSETKWKAQALACIELSFPAIDRLTDLLQGVANRNGIVSDPSTWGRRLTSFMLMLIQLCAESSLLIKITAVAQFLTHFQLPGLSIFRGYAQQLAQVFQTALERIRSYPDEGRDSDDEDELFQYGDPDFDYRRNIDETPFRAQGDADEKPPEGLLIGTTKLLCAMAGLTDYDVKVNGDRVRRLDQTSRTINSLDRLAQYVEKLFRYAYDAVSVHVFGVHPDMRELQLVSEKIPKWMDTITDLYNDNGMIKVTKDVSLARHVMSLQKVGDEYNALLWKFKVLPKAYGIFKGVYNMCDKMANAGAPYISDTNMRPSPFSMMLFGGPGLGKSVVQQFLTTDIMTHCYRQRGLIYRPGEQTYIRNSEMKHWDGYTGQAVVIVDDIFQSMDPATTIQQCMDICNAKNTVPWPLTKADLGSKGNTFMMAELLMMTGNSAVPYDIKKVIRTPEAIRRRIDMMIEHTVIKEYLNDSGRLDKDKLDRDFPPIICDGKNVCPDITSVMRFTVFDNQQRMIMQEGTYKQLLKLAIRMKETERDRDEALIRASYLRAGLDIYGKTIEEPFKAQMWTPFQSTSQRIVVDDYEDDLLFKADRDHIRALMNNGSIGYLTEHWENRQNTEGLLSAEESAEIYATIKQDLPPDTSWSARTKRLFHVLTDVTKRKSYEFSAMVGATIDSIRTKMTSSLVFAVGSMVLMAVSIVAVGAMSYSFFKQPKWPFRTTPELEKFAAENTSGDEKTRQIKTVMRVEAGVSGDDKTQKMQTKFVTQGEIATRIINGRKFVALETTPRSTTWVPESKVPKHRKPLTVNSVLWTDQQDELPRDVMSPGGIEDAFVAQACPDRNAYNLGINRVTNNAVCVQTYVGDRVVCDVRGLFIYGRVLMLPHHCLYGLDYSDTKITLTNSHGLKIEFNTNECDIKTPQDEKDVIFVRIPKRFQCYQDLRSHFHSEDALAKYPLRQAMLWVIDGENNSKMITLCDNIIKDASLEYDVTPLSKNLPERRIHLVKNYLYNGMTLGGYCGAPLIWINPSVQGGHILGIHVAGTNLRGMTTPITREFLYEFLSDWTDISIRVPDLDHNNGIMVAQGKRAIDRDTGLAHYGRVAPSQQVRIPSDTSIMRSPLFGVFEPVTAPAMLAPTNGINPLRNGILKQKVPLVIFPQHEVDQAMAHLRNSILSADSPYKASKHERMILTPEEALNGFPGDKWIPPMNLHTSPGYPFINSNTSRNGKFDFVTGEPGERRMHPIVESCLQRRLDNARDGIIDMTLFMDILKDERVKLEKVAIGKTRIFNVAPFDLNIAVRMYFQMFAAHLMHNHVYGECAVGLNPHSDEWGMVYSHMKTIGPNWIGGDYSNYDKQLSYQLLKAVLVIINDFYQDTNERIRDCLFETMFAAFHIAERDVYRVPQGNPSGIVMTSLVNSLVNSLMMRIVYLRLGGTLVSFDDNVRLKTYGDDNIAAVADDAKWFNMSSISRELAKFGVVYNQPNKEAMRDDKPFLARDEITFLKRAFRVERGRVLAPLSLDSIHEMINWIRSSNDDCLATRANFLAAAREMYHHGADAFAEFTTTVYVYAQKHSFLLPYTDYVTSGEYWGAESDNRVILRDAETTHCIPYCCDLANEETLFRAQSKRAPHKIKAVWPLLCDLLIIAIVINSTSKTEPTENTASSATNQDNITSRQEITTFSDSSVVTVTNPQNVAMIPATPVDPYMKETLNAFLQRVYYQTFTWTPSMQMGYLIAQVTFPNFLFSVVPIWDKLKNFTYFRAGVKIGIRMNGSKFHYGQILVSYSPQFNNTLDLVNASNNIYSASGNPCFMISPSENEVHEFTLPFALPYQYIPMYQLTGNGDPAYQFGVVNIYVVNPLSNAATPTPVSFTVFANFVDVDIAGYSPVSYTIPTRVVKTQATFPALLPTIPSLPTTIPQVDPLPPYVGVAESPFIAHGKASREQVQKSEKGMIGSVAESVSAIAGALSFIPEIGIVAAGVSTAASGVAAVANFFGWSNPPSLMAIQPILNQYSNLVNTHGLSDAQNLGIHPDAAVSQACELLGGHPREMNMLHIAQTPSLLCAGINWDESIQPSIDIYTDFVSPCAEYRDNPNSCYFPTLLSWVSRSCRYWRGSIRYHVQVTCSQMHVGRLRIYYVPYLNLNSLSADQLSSTTSMILDIQQQSSISFTVPYLFNAPWCETIQLTSGTYSLKPQGYIRIAVLNELNHPNVPVPAVFVNVWTSAGPDFQLARPDVEFLRTNIYGLTPSPEVEETPFVAQGLTRDAIRELPAPPLIPATGSREDSICMADEFHHIKDIIMRPCFKNYGPAALQPSYTGYAINPFNPTVAVTNPITRTDFLSYFKLIYRFSRGSNKTGFLQTVIGVAGNWTDRQNFIMNNEVYYNGTTPVALLGQVYSLGSQVEGSFLPNQLQAGTHYAQDLNMPQTATIPFYSTLYGYPNAIWNGSSVTASTEWRNYGTGPAANAYVRLGGTITLAAGDDFELAFMVGPPAVTQSFI